MPIKQPTLDGFAPPAPPDDGPYLLGAARGTRRWKHAVSPIIASVFAKVGAELDVRGIGIENVWVPAMCSSPVGLDIHRTDDEPEPGWVPFTRGDPYRDEVPDAVCPSCAWTVALLQGKAAVEQELAVVTPTGRTRAALRSLLVDPLVTRRLCEAILTDTYDDHDSDRRVQLLAQVTLHAPVLLLPEDCAEGTATTPASSTPTTTATRTGCARTRRRPLPAGRAASKPATGRGNGKGSS